MEEVWKDIPNYEGFYRASNLGRVESVKFNKLLSTKVSSGYSRLTLYKNKVKRGFLTHRLVMLTFQGDSELQVDHINGIKTDNRLINLRYVEPRENIKLYFDKVETEVSSIGIRIDKHGKYSSRIWLDGRRYDLGRYNNETLASEAYNKALIAYKDKKELPEERKYYSIYKGVSKAKDKFVAKIVINKVQYNLGTYNIEEKASDAYQEALQNWINKSQLPSYINPNKASKYEGIYYVKNANKPWKASVKLHDERIYIGYFKTEDDAHNAQINYNSTKK